jgi:hypothetical protein
MLRPTSFDKDKKQQREESSSLLHIEASWIRVSQSSLKTGECTMVGGAHGTITEVA